VKHIFWLGNLIDYTIFVGTGKEIIWDKNIYIHVCSKKWKKWNRTALNIFYLWGIVLSMNRGIATPNK
jgi:hypothetical protein